MYRKVKVVLKKLPEKIKKIYKQEQKGDSRV